MSFFSSTASPQISAPCLVMHNPASWTVLSPEAVKIFSSKNHITMAHQVAWRLKISQIDKRIKEDPPISYVSALLLHLSGWTALRHLC